MTTATAKQPVRASDGVRVLRGVGAAGLGSSNATGTIDPKGGDYKAGLIRNAAIITRGPAIGHDMWIDREMLEQVRDAINSGGGTKSRFAHPFLNDGIGTVLGRYFNARIDGDVTRADLHLFQAATKAPGGNLAEYVMSLAKEDPRTFGNSIAFVPDVYGEEIFIEENEGPGYEFRSPDPLNTDNLPHARLRQLISVDAVDEPAANASGFFGALAPGWQLKSASRDFTKEEQTEWDRLGAELDPTKVQAAYHEAAHATVCHYFNCPVQGATVNSCAEYVGKVILGDSFGKLRPHERMACMLAGAVGSTFAPHSSLVAHRFRDLPPAEISHLDWQHIDAAIPYTGGRQRDELLDQATGRAFSILCDHREALDAIAARLLAAGALSGAEIKKIYDAHPAEEPVQYMPR